MSSEWCQVWTELFISFPEVVCISDYVVVRVGHGVWSIAAVAPMNEWSVLLWMQYTVVVPCLVLSTQSLANYWWRRSMLCVVCLCVFLLFLVSAIHSIRRLPVAVTPSILSQVFSHRNASILYFLTSIILAKHRVQSNWCQFNRDNRILRKFVEWLDFYGHQHFVHATQKQERMMMICTGRHGRTSSIPADKKSRHLRKRNG